MQRKYINGFIALGFAISMELVLAIHILLGAGRQAPAVPLVSTIDLHKEKSAGQASQETQPAQDATIPGLDGDYVDPTLADWTEEAPTDFNPAEAYPSPESVLLEVEPTLDDDHPPGSEPGDSESPAQQDSYPPPGDTNNPAANSGAPTATSNPPATTQQPAITATATPKHPTATAESTGTTEPRPGGTLVSVRVQEAPRLDGSDGDAAWEQAPEVVIQTAGGANQSATTVSIRSVYDGENVYFLVRWADPTQSLLLHPWEQQADGSWKRLVGEGNKGSDENEYYQDWLALLWPVNDSLEDFAGQGCTVACHSGEKSPEKATGLMYTGGPGQIGDMWQFKSVSNDGQVDDEYLDDTRYSKDTPWAGFHADPGKGGYRPNQVDDRSAPAYMPPGGGEKTGAPGYILDADKETLNPQLFASSERLPSVIKAPFTGDRGDIRGRWKYLDGGWTLELSRKLVTGSPFDVQFDDLHRSYSFALATFDQTQVRHAVQSGAVEFRFEK